MLHCNRTSGWPWFALLRVLLAALFILPAAALSQQSGTQDPTEDQVKAAMVFNFARYTEWPAAVPGDADLSICNTEAGPLSDKLQALDGRELLGRRIRVHAPALPGEWRSCHLLYIPQQGVSFDRVQQHTHQASILTISDQPGFVQAGGIIGLRMRAGRIRFDINQGAARRAGLTLSSQLLKRADEVIQ